MKIALISQEYRFVTSGPDGAQWKFFNFRISSETPSFLNLVYSGFATPARYLMELLRRLVKIEADSIPSQKLLFNPLFGLDKNAILLVLERIRHLSPITAPVIFCDSEDYPVAYLLPPSVAAEDGKFLSLLSTVDASLDQALLNHLFRGDVEMVRLARVSVNTGFFPHFYDGPYFDIYKWTARNALETLQSQGPVNAHSAESIPFAAVMPHHAGDLLFLALASQHVSSHISQVVVNQSYVDVVTTNSRTLEPVMLELPPLNRNGIAVPEWKYFRLFENTLPKNRFYFYMRPSSNYDNCKFHLIDQFAFALGKEYYSSDDLLIRSKRPPALFQPEHGRRPFNILLHFDSGWPLKIYPLSYQEALVKLLLDRGYKVTVLDGKHPLACPSVSFLGYQEFVELLQVQHMLVGMDSFPAHYAAHVLGLPTLCLFSSTQPANSNAAPAANYRYLEKGLGCCPCRAVAKCPLNGTPTCNNFAAPETVVREIEDMLKTVYSETDAKSS